MKEHWCIAIEERGKTNAQTLTGNFGGLFSTIMEASWKKYIEQSVQINNI